MADHTREYYETEATFSAGVMRWKSNGRVPPHEYVMDAFMKGCPVRVLKCDAERDTETRAFLAAYRANPPQLSAGMVAEMRAAFGPDAKVVNIIRSYYNLMNFGGTAHKPEERA